MEKRSFPGTMETVFRVWKACHMDKAEEWDFSVFLWWTGQGALTESAVTAVTRI